MNGGSGTPYTASQNVVGINQSGTNLVKGQYFGSRLPWSFRLDLTVDKDIYINSGKGEEGRQSYFNVYFRINNLLNQQNVLNVYPYTGNPDDDGFLTAPEWQKLISEQLDPQAYRDLYAIAVNTPGNYARPRTIRLGVIFNF